MRSSLVLERNIHHSCLWHISNNVNLLIRPLNHLSPASISSSYILPSLVFTSCIGTGYAHLDHRLFSTPETIEHRILRSRKSSTTDIPEFPFKTRPTQTLTGLWTSIPQLVLFPTLKVVLLNNWVVDLMITKISNQVSCRGSPVVCSDRSAAYWLHDSAQFRSREEKNLILHGEAESESSKSSIFQALYSGGIEVARPLHGWSNVVLPGKSLVKI